MVHLGAISILIGYDHYQNRQKYLKQIGAYCPGFLHHLYQNVTSIKGNTTVFAEITISMNLMSAVLSGIHPSKPQSQQINGKLMVCIK